VLREVLLRYWQQWRANQHQLSLFVDFLAAWFQREELEELRESQARAAGVDPEWVASVSAALATQSSVYDRFAMNQQLDNSNPGIATDEASTDPIIRRILQTYTLPPVSLGVRLDQARLAGDWNEFNRLIDEACLMLENEQIPADQEIATLTRIIAGRRGETPLRAAEAARKRRPFEIKSRYLWAVALEGNYSPGEAVEAATDLLRQIYEDEDWELIATCHYRIGWCQARMGDLAGAQVSLDRALRIYRDTGDLLGKANCLKRQGDLHVRLADLEGARASYGSALTIYREIRDRLGEANCLQSLGNLRMLAGDLDARTSYDGALAIYREIRDRLGEANCLQSLGALQMRVDDLNSARVLYESALPIFRETQDRLGEANCLRSLGDLQMRMTDLDSARASYEGALLLFREIRERLGEANCLLRMGDLQMRLADMDGARASYESALPIFREVRERRGEANCLINFGKLLIEIEKPEDAIRVLKEGIILSKELGDAAGLMAAYGYYADTLMALQQPLAAVSAFEKSLKWARTADDEHGQALILERQIRALFEIGDMAGALAALLLCRPMAVRAGLAFVEWIDDRVVELRKTLGDEANQVFGDPEMVRLRSVASATRTVNLLQRLESYPNLVRILAGAVGLITSRANSEAEITVVQQAVAGALVTTDGSEIALAFLSGALMNLINQGRHDDALTWISRLDQWLPEERQGLFSTMAIAARHLRGAKEDARILDQQPPEVRAAVESIVQAAHEKRSSHGDGES
jgi:tetratricopeptide (TPR) repeat protein